MRTFQGERCRHDLPVYGPDGIGRKGTGVLRNEAFDDRRFPGRGMEIRTGIVLFFQLADLDDTF